jgi:hypothetical protein
MDAKKRVHRLLMAGAVTAVLAGAAVGSVAVFDSGASEPAVELEREAPTARTDAVANPWAANDCAVLVEALGQNAPSACR